MATFPQTLGQAQHFRHPQRGGPISNSEDASFPPLNSGGGPRRAFGMPPGGRQTIRWHASVRMTIEPDALRGIEGTSDAYEDVFAQSGRNSRLGLIVVATCTWFASPAHAEGVAFFCARLSDDKAIAREVGRTCRRFGPGPSFAVKGAMEPSGDTLWLLQCTSPDLAHFHRSASVRFPARRSLLASRRGCAGPWETLLGSARRRYV
jgi:hypothetical protein